MSYTSHRLDGLRLRHLRLLELIEEHRSLRAVGEVLNRTQPAVSQMVKDLEYALGATLVDRSVRGVELTSAGRLALQRARSGLASLHQMASELNADQSPTLRVGTNPALVFQMLPAAMRRLGTENPRMRYQLQAGIVGDMLDALWDGDLDCYVGSIDWDRIPRDMLPVLRHDPLIQTDLVLACSVKHPLADRTDVTMAELVEWSWVLPPADSNNHIALETAFRNHGVAGPTPIVECAAGPSAQMILARELDALTLVPRLMFDAPVLTGELRVLDIPALKLPPIQIGFLTLAEHEQMAAVHLLRQALRKTASQFGQAEIQS
ncbi:LysR family transcriptional regulator [Hwanghaeella grinnelliae]|uniref:LysR family transcriptional regulator n=1 Tax=Hwanghaeella grinnelliae TaxID=2500179 RepID=A0A3S2WVQ4_9PROT|nr:LysR substrate-binding domain-containing protein [Hwanghaeella grinnelliae]RVU39565.1 LysR family transcriptional regulator [Hwanghaeella grinnelliae]